MHSKRFIYIRKKELENIFSKQSLKSIWKNIVKEQLRPFDIHDLFYRRAN
ncbi:hypothetical protein LEP1GSC077_0393 [Leptospira interrogans str. C10069]|uniref:Uncharacterized protein n=1 Tax=Leptospira interrogans serovar Zanoni str. LT2156 TaxID=1001601 RepID=M6HRP4_LEPIR|nr:hypothetical protein LEP1GSC077_0393 [Leptospira interrogans str. C10069]EKR27478.1 hypothetical protein LEP1GSC087_2181 [Leptospira interrogans serovar Bataviae str. L1111]EMM97674.1 hypothetical protein LEP1GSC158_3443 [Leptospira interrogans serovar Zanoni str. LT2156]EMN64304.1 hypothetical protein LEP1GSC092_0465 [Leptospira interrogans serovar Pyrogenes str. R168]